jgi:CO/xanthine dehydrogenase FAD-binding subunit
MTLVTMSDGVCIGASVTLMGVGSTAIKARETCDLLVGTKPTSALISEGAKQAREEADPDDDIHATATFRRDLIESLTQAALTEAFQKAGANLG